MPGLTLGIGETNPKRGAVQYDTRRLDGVPFVIPTGAGITSAPIGSVVTLQECTGIGQRIVLGPNAYTDDAENTYTIKGWGFLEAATQADGSVDQTVGEYSSGDMACMIMDINVVVMAPMLSGSNPGITDTVYVSVDGKLTSTAYENVIFPGVIFLATPGVQQGNQLKSGYCFARLAPVELSVALLAAAAEA